MADITTDRASARLHKIGETLFDQGLTALADELFSLATEALRLEDNLVYLASCTAATAYDVVERKSFPRGELGRHGMLMDVCISALNGMVVARFPPDATHAIARCTRAAEAIKKRLARRRT